MLTKLKSVLAGYTLKFNEYQTALEYGEKQQRKKNNVPREKTEKEKRHIATVSIYRTKTALKNLITANAKFWRDGTGKPYLPLFLTFTFAENLTNINIAHNEFKKFIKRFNYAHALNLKYLVVPEFQKRGAVHYHCIFFNLPYIDNLFQSVSEIWGQGFTFIESVKDTAHLANYVSKYLAKDLADQRLQGRKHYFASRGLLKPKTVYNETYNRTILSLVPQEYKTFEKEFETSDGVKIKSSIFKIPELDTNLLSTLNWLIPVWTS